MFISCNPTCSREGMAVCVCVRGGGGGGGGGEQDSYLGGNLVVEFCNKSGPMKDVL